MDVSQVALPYVFSPSPTYACWSPVITHSFNKHFPSCFHRSGVVLGARDATRRKKATPSPVLYCRKWHHLHLAIVLKSSLSSTPPNPGQSHLWDPKANRIGLLRISGVFLLFSSRATLQVQVLVPFLGLLPWPLGLFFRPLFLPSPMLFLML